MKQFENHHPKVTIHKPGWLTTVQDLGRHGYQQYGVPVSGAMDRQACVVANRLVGNVDEAAVLEITLQGPELHFHDDAVVAVTGADLSPSLNGLGLPLWTSVPVKQGSRLTFGRRRAGARSYLAIAGGIAVPVMLGSRSTHVSSGTGGVQGRALRAGDALVGGRLSVRTTTIGRALPEPLRPVYAPAPTLRILAGPQNRSFADGALDVLTSHPYRLTSHSDRMGYRLDGPTLDTATEQWISGGTATGALQIPKDGRPILLMADRQTTGGYPIIAVVISADLHLAAQLLPGDTIRFRLTSLPEAQAILRAQRKALDDILPPSGVL